MFNRTINIRRISLWGVVAACAVLLSAPAAFAVPALQLDILGGVYDPFSETVIAPGDSFTLYALLDSSNTKVDITDTYFVSAAIVPKTTPAGSFGSFDFSGADVSGSLPVGNGDSTIDVTGEMTFGAAPMESSIAFDPGDLAKHGIFETFYTEFAFTFDPLNTSALYNSQDTTGAGPGGTGDLLWSAFTVDTSALNSDLEIHFDLYSIKIKDPGGIDPDLDKHLFAPFSHDAQSGLTPLPPPPVAVPEPSTMLLFGTGVLGLIGYARRRQQKPTA